MNWKTHVKNRFKDKKGFPVVEVLWDDALAKALDWESEVTYEVMPTTSIGYLIHEDDQSVTIVGIINETHVAHGLTLPRGMIKHLRHL